MKVARRSSYAPLSQGLDLSGDLCLSDRCPVSITSCRQFSSASRSPDLALQIQRRYTTKETQMQNRLRPHLDAACSSVSADSAWTTRLRFALDMTTVEALHLIRACVVLLWTRRPVFSTEFTTFRYEEVVSNTHNACSLCFSSPYPTASVYGRVCVCRLQIAAST